jgi:hypothetical protein
MEGQVWATGYVDGCMLSPAWISLTHGGPSWLGQAARLPGCQAARLLPLSRITCKQKPSISLLAKSSFATMGKW